MSGIINATNLEVENIKNTSGTPYNFIKKIEQATLNAGTSTTTHASFVDTGLQVIIQPSSTNSKILLKAEGVLCSGNGWYQALTIDRNGTNIGISVSHGASFPTTLLWMHTDGGGSTPSIDNFAFTKLDSPNTTSSLTYKLQFAVQNGGTSYLGRRSTDTNLTCPTYLTAMEVAG